MTIKSSLACAAVLMAMAAAPAVAQDDGEPVVQEMSAETLYAATCLNAAAMLLRNGGEVAPEEVQLLEDAFVFWDARHKALEPNEEARRQQWVTAAEMIVESGGEEAEGIEPGFVVILANCQTRRAELLRTVADPAGAAALQ